MKQSLSILVLIFLFGACTFVQERYSKLPPGPYRGVLKLENTFVSPNPKGEPLPEKVDLVFDEVTDGELPFTFEVEYENDSIFKLTIINGEERIPVPSKNISYGRDRSQGRDTLRIDFPVYDTYISAYHEENIIEGVWVVNYRDNYRVPFVAEFGQNHRFTKLRKEPITDMSGDWAMNFSEGDEPFVGLGEFRQEGNELTGTIRTETGDYRYLEGTIQADKFYLSVFDGSHAFLFEGKLSEDGSRMAGSFRSGRHYITDFSGRRDPNFVLADPDTLTSIDQREPLEFSFPNANGDSISLSDPRFQDKVTLVSIMGTWCPNCRDEANYLREYRAANPDQDFEIISLAYERYGATDARSVAAIQRYEDNMNIDWPILLAGSSGKSEAAKTLPALNHVLSYPTLIFLDKEGKVRRIHTGFNGPATSAFAEFDTEFRETMDELLAE
ncbi:alkyl hydroperoxide reductase [Lewinellaceae bacterium SD302]|nr:alkyl hydroperoxide reductase [Lewinellaceae bacterium SD302]